MECFRRLLEHIAWIEHQFLRGIRDSRGRESVRDDEGMEGVRKSIHQSWLAKVLGFRLELLCWGLRAFWKRFRQKRPALFKSNQWHFHQDNAPVHNSIHVTDYSTKMGIKTVPHPLYCLDVALCDFWLLPKLRGCRYVTIEEMKEAVILSHKRTSMGPWRNFLNGTRSALQPVEITSKETRVLCVYYQ